MYTIFNDMMETVKSFKSENQGIYDTLIKNNFKKENITITDSLIEIVAGMLDENEKSIFIEKANTLKRENNKNIEKIEKDEAIIMAKYNNAVKQMEMKFKEVLGENLEIFAHLIYYKETMLSKAILEVRDIKRIEYVLLFAFFAKREAYEDMYKILCEKGIGLLDIDNELEKYYNEANKLIANKGKYIIGQLEKFHSIFTYKDFEKLRKKVQVYNKQVRENENALKKCESNLKNYFERYKEYCDEDGEYDPYDREFFSLSMTKEDRWNEIMNLIKGGKYQEYKKEDFEKTIIECKDWMKVQCIMAFVDGLYWDDFHE